MLGIEIEPVSVDLEDRKHGHSLGAIVGNKTNGFFSYILDDRVGKFLK